MKKLLFCLADGMRPDGFLQCGSAHLQELMNIATYTLNARTVFPSVTLPCHMSIFHGVTPERHGILSNDYVPQVHYVKGIFEKVSDFGGENAFLYGWEPLRDIGKPGSVKYALFRDSYCEESADTFLTGAAAALIAEKHPDFVFLYLPDVDERGGHDCGWMSEGYLERVRIAVDNVYRMVKECGDEYTVIFTADHGGHDRLHGTTMEEDMTVPIFCIGPDFKRGEQREEGSILDIAPTVAQIMGFPPEREWEGKSMVK